MLILSLGTLLPYMYPVYDDLSHPIKYSDYTCSKLRTLKKKALMLFNENIEFILMLYINTLTHSLAHTLSLSLSSHMLVFFSLVLKFTEKI